MNVTREYDNVNVTYERASILPTRVVGYGGIRTRYNCIQKLLNHSKVNFRAGLCPKGSF